MNDKNTEDAPVFQSGKARWIQEQGSRALGVQERALLLALVRLESELGRTLKPDEEEALEALSAQLHEDDARAISQAIHKMVEAPADPERKLSWPELKQRSKS